MRKIFTLLLLLAGFSVAAQQYNNEWIQFNQTYYKIKVAKSGIFRISKTVLDAVGAGNTPVEFFELWRNGERVAFYPSVASGVLPVNGYLEFWGMPNDGKPDRAMYREPGFQHTTKTSLITDTATYFLSVNGNQSGFRITDVVNNVAGNVLPAEPWFMYTAGNYYRNRFNAGFAAVVGEYVYSASYDKGEYYSSPEVRPPTPLTTTLNNLFVYTSGPGSSIQVGTSGNALNPRTVNVKINGNVVGDTLMDYFNNVNGSFIFPTSHISTSSAAVTFTNTSAIASDRLVVSHFEITYPRQFNFGNQKNFEFNLPAKAGGYFLQITNFSTGGVAPVLYDTYNGERYVGDISNPAMVQFALPGTATERRLVLVSSEAANVNTVTTMTTRQFLRFTDAANQGNYMIITNPVLYTGSAGNNPVNDYKAYRQSAAGGSYTVSITEIDEIIDQFGFGIKRHPMAVKNFIRYARTHFAQPVKYVFIIGRGMTYVDYRNNQADPQVDLLNLVPTFGSPGSDNMLSSADASSPVPVIPIGRLSVVRGSEIEDYLEKVKEYDIAQTTAANNLAGREWMKNIVHVTGSSDPYLGTVLCNYMGVLKEIIEDTIFGGKVSTFCKTSTNPVEQVSSERLASLFHEGVSILTYFGHSSSTTLEFNIDNPQAYDNRGKYPVFYVNGCNAGNFFTFYPQRLLVNETLSEKFVLAKHAGSIAFVASTHFGIVNYLNLYLTNLYSVIGQQDYNKSLGEVSKDALAQMMNATGPYDYYARLHAEEITLHGDPAIKVNGQSKPDYTIEESLVRINPNFISVAENSFDLKFKIVNLGITTQDSVLIEVKQQYPGAGGTAILYSGKIKYIPYADSLTLTIPIIATRDKGLNKITISIDPNMEIDEMSDANNVVVKEFNVYEDEARPAYPYNYAIINSAAQKLYASTANPLSTVKNYIMEIDTSGAFTSSLKVTKNVTASGGIIEVEPGLTYIDSTVYHWRITPVPESGSEYRWNASSFMYINGTTGGFNQSDFYQNSESETKKINLDAGTRKWKFGFSRNNFTLRNGVFPTAANQAIDISVTVNNDDKVLSVCGVSNIIFSVFDPVTLQPWLNALNGQPSQYGSDPVCGNTRRYNFQFNLLDTAKRRKMVEFLDLIPPGHFVAVRNVSDTFYSHNTYASDWIKDTSYLGTYNSIYHRLLGQGFTTIDSFNRPRAFLFFFKKDEQSFFAPRTLFSNGINDRITLTTEVITPDTVGTITSPLFGPATQWHEVQWNGESLEAPGTDGVKVDVVGVDNNGVETVLYSLDKNTHTQDISAIDAAQYPNMKLRMRNIDSVNLTPYQLKYWRILYDPVPEGAVAANLFFTSRDTVDVGEKINFGIAFKNIGQAAFDSILVKITIIGNDNVPHVIQLPRYKPIVSNDTIKVMYEVDTKDYPGNNTLLIDINPNGDQAEHYHFNNFMYHNFYARVDNTNPLLDVTFDGVHILNRDIVSARPHIQIKLKDEAKYLLLNDTSLASIEVKYPNGSTRTYNFDSDTLRFIPATDGADNTATIDFTPVFNGQINPAGDEYELVVRGKDRSGNKAGVLEYRIAFRVISKAMISNLLNYPNPFSTSTAFVFTITGSELPQNMKIQVLTVTGKIVREITMNELGPLHIGRNITEFKWDGTDQYGQKLANGVYLYRVVTTMNGKPMEKYRAEGDNTDKFFTNGYGKMY